MNEIGVFGWIYYLGPIIRLLLAPFFGSLFQYLLGFQTTIKSLGTIVHLSLEDFSSLERFNTHLAL